MKNIVLSFLKIVLKHSKLAYLLNE